MASACRSLTSLVGHISILPNVVMCWFLSPELSLADDCVLPPLIVDDSVIGLKPTFLYKPTYDLLKTLVLRVYYLLTYLCIYVEVLKIAAYHVKPSSLNVFSISVQRLIS